MAQLPNYLDAEELQRLLLEKKRAEEEAALAQQQQATQPLRTLMIQPSQEIDGNTRLQQMLQGSGTEGSWSEGASGRPMLQMAGPKRTPQDIAALEAKARQDEMQAIARNLMERSSDQVYDAKGNLDRNAMIENRMKAFSMMQSLGKPDLDADLKRAQAEKYRAEALVAGQPKSIKLDPHVNASGDIGWYDAQGNLIKTSKGAGKPSATHEKGVAAKQKGILDIGLAITELENATKPGGLIEKSTGSGIGAAVDWMASGAGYSTQGARAIGALRPVFDLVLKQVPRFEGPQSDADTESYKQAAGDIANPNIPPPQKLDAANTILRIMKKRRAQFVAVNPDNNQEIPLDASKSQGTGAVFLGFEK